MYAKIDWVFICSDLCRNAMYIGNEGKNSYSIARQMDEIIVEISLCTCECDLWNLTCTLDLHSIKVITFSGQKDQLKGVKRGEIT